MPRPLRRLTAGAVVSSVIASSAIVLGAAAPAAAAYPETFNPFAIGGGFTVYAREDASLGNTETEGSVAVGGELTKPGEGQYTLVHVVAGTGDYTLPTVDGDPTRLLVGSYSPASGGITAITSAGTSEPSLQGALKMVERTGPFQAFPRADWLRLNLDPSAPDRTPLIDATHQQYPADAEPPSGGTGDDSIYTVDTSGTAVSSYVEAGRQASWAQAAQCLADVSDPLQEVGFPVSVAENYGDRVVLAPLSADRPNVVDYADIAGTALIQFSSGPEPGTANPLIIRVPAGTSDVIGARADPQAAYSPYILWDLSAITGSVTMTAAQGRIDGSIYAPEADITVDAQPLDGQVVGRNVSTLGGEIHSFMFAGEIACTSDSGGFRVRKAISGIDPADPAVADLVFTVNYTATPPDGADVVGSIDLPASGEWVDAGERFPDGTVVSFEEIPPPTIPGYAWDPAVITPDPLTIEAGATAEVSVTNAATAQRGTFSVSKEVTVSDGTAPVLSGEVTVSWSALYRDAEVGSGQLTVPLDGTPISPTEDFPLGTVVTFTEDLSSVVTPTGYEWTESGWDPGQSVTISETSDPAAVVLTNVLSPVDTRSVNVMKEVAGEGADPRFQYAISYNIDPTTPGGEERRTREIAVGDPISLDDLETGATTIELAELIPAFDSQPVDVSDWDAPVFRVTDGNGVTDYPAAGFEGQVPLEDAIVSIPLPADGSDIAVSVVNSQRTGTFTIAKELVGIEPEALPDGTAFTVSWTATTPVGTVTEGTLRAPADGTPVSPVDENGMPLQFPFGTTVSLEEELAPTLRDIGWGTTTIEPDPLVIGADGANSVAATVTNTATVTSGTFLVAKQLTGIEPGELTVSSFTVAYLAVPPGGGFQTGTFELPVDGTPAGPVDASGDPLSYPVGTFILLAESPPPDEALPEFHEWAHPVWSPGRTLQITGDDQPTEVTVTNTAVEYGEVSLTKTVSGDAGMLPPDAVFTADWWLDSEPQPALSLQAGETVTSDRFPVGSIIEAGEPQPPVVPGVAWGTPVWMVEGQQLPVEENGRVVIPVAADDQPISIELTNVAASASDAGFSVEKSVTGTTTDLPDGIRYPIEYRVDGGQIVQARVGVEMPLRVDGLPSDAVVQVREPDPPEIDGVNWGQPEWSTEAGPLTADADGWVTVALSPGETVDLALTNSADDDLPVTGGEPDVGSIWLGAILLATGALLVAARRRHSVDAV